MFALFFSEEIYFIVHCPSIYPPVCLPVSWGECRHFVWGHEAPNAPRSVGGRAWGFGVPPVMPPPQKKINFLARNGAVWRLFWHDYPCSSQGL